MLKAYLRTFKGLSREVWLLSFVMLINRAGAMVLPFLSVYLEKEIELDLSKIGYVLATFGLGSMLGTYVGGQLTDKYGFYRIMVWSLIFTGISLIMLQTAHTFERFCVLIFITSFLADLFRPAVMTAIGSYSKPENFTRSLSLLRLAINLGWSIGPAVGGFIAYNYGYIPLFWVDGLTCISAAFLVYFLLKNEDSAIVKKNKDDTADVKAPSPYHDFRYLFFVLMVALMALVFLMIISLLPIFFKNHFAMNEDQIGAILALNAITVVVVEMPLIHYLEKKGYNRLLLIQIGTFIIGFAYFVFVLVPGWVGIAIVSMLLLSLGEVLAMPISNAYSMNRTVPANRGKYMALYAMAYSLAHIVSPVFGTHIAEAQGYMFLWNVLFALSIVSVLGFGLIKRLDKRDVS